MGRESTRQRQGIVKINQLAQWNLKQCMLGCLQQPKHPTEVATNTVPDWLYTWHTLEQLLHVKPSGSMIA